MRRMTVTEYIRNNILILDGAMGTQLHRNGLKPGELPEKWNTEHPDIITGIHRDYFDAGANMVCTNTFGANSLKFGKEELEEIIKAAVENARRAAEQSGAPQEKWVALDVGPSGRMLAPYGDLDFEEAVSLFSEVAGLGERYGADLIYIETMNDSYETKAAVLGAREGSSLPVFVTNAYGEDGKLMTGASPRAMVAMLEGLGADAIGVNCSLGPKALSPVVEEYLAYASVPVIMKPNAGLPKVENGETVYDVGPEEFSEEVGKMIKKGVRLAGGCCGTTPEYIKGLAAKAAGARPVRIKAKNHTMVSGYADAVIFGEAPVLIGERINPTGKKAFKEALRSGDTGYILREGIGQKEKGAHILDVNVGLPEIDEKTELTRAVCELQSVVDIPLQIDTSDPVAMENALRRYNGKAMINSVNGKRESMDRIFPIAKKYGGVLVALTLDESGIPETAVGRLAIARKILNEAARYGIRKKDIVFDPLALTIGTGKDAAKVTLDSISLIKTVLGCRTSLGVSNVSFGLPRREIINSSFFTMAMARGLSCAIINPYSDDMMKAYMSFKALAGLDGNCTDYIGFAEKLPQTVSGTAASSATGKTDGGISAGETDLVSAIVNGMKDEAGSLTAAMLQEGRDPLDVINSEVIPALDEVGRKYESKIVYLPQLLMSAEAAKASFTKIRSALAGSSVEQAKGKKCKVVIATVHGDIHDIGKNIVKLLLENYGFDVMDLGKDVPPEVIVDSVVSCKAPLLGLSALMTTTVPAMEETIRQIRKHAPWCRVVVGGAVLTQEYADSIGADRYARDAMETVRYADSINSETKKTI